MKLTIGVLGIIALTGCTIERTVVQEATTTTVATVTSSPSPTYQRPITGTTVENRFIKAVYDLYGPLYGAEPDAIETGYGVCEALDNGMSASGLETAIMESATDQDGVDLLSAITVAAIAHFCPWYSGIFDIYS